MREISCCGGVYSTRFCPTCGKKLQDDPILEVLNHMKKKYASLRTVADRLNEKAAASSDSNIKAKAAKKQEAVVRWETWIKAVSDMYQESRKSDSKLRELQPK